MPQVDDEIISGHVYFLLDHILGTLLGIVFKFGYLPDYGKFIKCYDKNVLKWRKVIQRKYM